MTILCLPGFLGIKKDFDFLHGTKHVLPLFEKDANNKRFSQSSLTDFPQALERYLTNETLTCDVAIGYSLGGRLLLHTVIAFPNLFKKIIIIAAHPGLQSEDERVKRIAHDMTWKEKFKSEPWDQVIQEWNNLPVLSSTSHVERFESDYNKEVLLHALTVWSLGNQENLAKKLAKLSTEILWIVGEKDEKFLQIGQNLAKMASCIRLETVSDAGHRVMWEKSQVIDTLVHTYVENN